MRYSRRQVMKQAALLSVAGGAAACSSGPANTGTGTTSLLAPAAAAAPFDLHITIHGAYGLIIRKNGGLTVASLAHPGEAANHCKYEYEKHQMLLVVTQGTHDANATTHKPKPAVTGEVTHWKLSGAITIKSGATPGLVALPPTSVRKDEFDPFAPMNPGNEWAWNDRNYVPLVGNAGTNWQSRADATFDLPEGRLRILPPPNEYARIGRWRWPVDPNLKPEDQPPPRAVSDRVLLESKATGTLILSSSQGDIVLSPQNNLLLIEIVSEVNAKQQVIKKDDLLGHYAMLYDFVDPSLSCNDRRVPAYEPIAGRRVPDQNNLTPGVECPLGFVKE